MSHAPLKAQYTLVYVPEAFLKDGEHYLVKTKHGFIEGRWDKSEEVFKAYFWRDIEFYGDAYDIESVSLELRRPAKGDTP